jgi:hypothetical protein
MKEPSRSSLIDRAVEMGGPGRASLKQWNKAKKWYTFAALAVLNGILLFLLLNLVLYAIFYARRYRLDKLLFADNDLFSQAYPGWRKEDVKTLISESYGGHPFVYEPFVEFTETPFRSKFLNIDPAGFRVSKNQAPWPPRLEANDVFVFGGSTTFGFGLPDDETIASYLQECAAANHSVERVAVYNFGREGYFSSQEVILFQQLLNAGFVPKVAVFIDGLNDFGSAAYGEPVSSEQLRRFMEGRPDSGPLEDVPVIRAAHRLADRWTKPSENATDYADREVLEGVVHRWLANKRMIEVIAHGFGVRPIFVWQPVPTYKYDVQYHFLFHSKLMFGVFARCRSGYPLMEDLRAQGKLGPNVLWLADMQQDRRENFYVDGIHYNAAFSKEIAARICSFLREPSRAVP